jgi:hypothetical protein
MLRRLSLLLILSLAITALRAQDMATIKGAVADENGKALDLVNVVVKENQQYNTSTDEKGNYVLKVPAGKKITIVYSRVTQVIYTKVILPLKNDEIQISFQVESAIQGKEIEIRDQTNRKEGITDIKVKELLLPDAGGGGIEAFLAAQALGINKSNELSSNYSVRGGSFDENLVYVNDFEIYRPYLIRSGQQEGLSFANPNLVSNIKFSSGGFQAKYGDKLSSVLDVTYKRPSAWGGSVSASLLGVAAHVEGVSKDPKRFTFLLGFRQKSSQYILGTLDTKGQYSPNFLDVQLFATVMISQQVSMEIISNFARNQFLFVPDSRTTKFGSVSTVKQLEMAFEGQELDNYLSITNGLSLIYKPKENLKIKFLASVYNDMEHENFDILADYRIGDVESDPGKSNYGQVTNYSGIGGVQNWGRNTLYTDVYTAGVRGSWFSKRHNLQWGVDYKHEVIQDKLSEWDRLDSAGYSLPFTVQGQKSFYGDTVPLNNNPSINMDRVLKSSFNLSSNRVSAFIQDTWRFGDSSRFSLNYGVRFQYWDVNKEPTITPRVQLAIKPTLKKDIILTVAGGLYYQPPFYREMRGIDSNGNSFVNTGLRAQKSAHAVIGFNYAFKAWGRPFSFVTEAYYKYLWDVVSFDYDNTLIRYSGRNDAKGYAAGVDMRLNGELAEGAESWISLSFMNTENVIAGATKTIYLDSNGKQVSIVNNLTKPTITDTVKTAVGYQPRPTNQLVTFNLFFQDYIPKWPFIRFNLNLVFGSGIPVKAPTATYYSPGFTLPFYKRVDMGFAAQLWNPKWAKKKTAASKAFKSVWLSLDVLNIFGIENVVSYLWVKDFYNNQYAVPNNLTGRRVNLKLVFNFGS